MALPKLLEDLAFISKLGDYPGSDDNLTTEQFRERFDMAALRIQKYLNEQLIPGLDQLVDVRALLNGILDSTLSLSDKAANAKATGDALNRKLDKTGGDMTGQLSVLYPTKNSHATNKQFVEDKVDYILTFVKERSPEVLPVNRGGSGLSTVKANSFLVGNGTNAMTSKTPSEVRSLIGAGIEKKTLWSGSWESGSITVEGLNDFMAYKISLDSTTSIVAVRIGNYIRGINGYVTSSTESGKQLVTIHFGATIDGNKLTLEEASILTHHMNGNHGSSFTKKTVQSIIGLC